MTGDKIEISIALGFNPISNYEFSRLSNENSLIKILSNSHLYMICQRSELVFQNIQYNSKENLLEFEIEKKGRMERLKIIMDIYQECLTTNKSEKIHFKPYTYHQDGWQKSFPYSNVRGFQLHTNQKYLWVTPDRLLWDYFHKKITLKIFGDYSEFITFKVLYIGKSTKQNITTRLKNHHKLLKILSEEEQTNGMLTDEIILLLFKVKEYGLASKTLVIKDMNDNIINVRYPDFPSMKEISLDAEKALTRILKPIKDNYTGEVFKGYPKSSDGLQKFKYDDFCYYICDNLVLVGQGDKKLRGNINTQESDKIKVQNQDVNIVN